MRALRRRSHWNHFLLPVRDWLDTWHPAATGLLLIGPSAGWCIPDSFLGRFSQIHALDIDPLAGKIFRVLHRKIIAGRRIQLTWQEGDLFEQLEDLLCKYPDHAVLFCNVLGQHGLHLRSIAKMKVPIVWAGEGYRRQDEVFRNHFWWELRLYPSSLMDRFGMGYT